jgi:hypothetical protein
MIRRPLVIASLVLGSFTLPRSSLAYFSWVQVNNAPSCIDNTDYLYGPTESNRVSIAGGGGWLYALGCDDDSGDGGNSSLWGANNNASNPYWYRPLYWDSPAQNWLPVRGDSVYAARNSQTVYVNTNPYFPPFGATTGALYKYDPGTGIRTQLPGGIGWQSVAADQSGDVFTCGYNGTSGCGSGNNTGPCAWELQASNQTWYKMVFSPPCQQITIDGSNGYSTWVRDGNGNVYYETFSCFGRFCFPSWHTMATAKCGGGTLNAQLIAVYNGTVYALDYTNSVGPANVYTATAGSSCWSLLSSFNNQMMSIGIDNSVGAGQIGPLYGVDSAGQLWRWSNLPQ